MDYNTLYYYLLETCYISPADYELFKQTLTEQRYKKNTIVVNQGDNEVFVYLVKIGNLMTYHETNRKLIHVIQLGHEGWWTGDVESLAINVGSNFTIKSMTDSCVLIMDKAGYEKLLEEAPTFRNYFRLIFMKLMINFQKRVVQNITLSAEERYSLLVKEMPKCELIFPQKYIAAYLGITPEFLSKMKARLK